MRLYDKRIRSRENHVSRYISNLLYLSISTVTCLGQSTRLSHWGSTWLLCFTLVLLQFLLHAFPTLGFSQLLYPLRDAPYLLLPVAGSFPFCRSHFQHCLLRSEGVLTSWSKVTLFFCSPPITLYSVSLLRPSWRLSNLLQFCFLFASMLGAVPPIRISVPQGQGSGLMSLLAYLQLPVQLVTHRIEGMTLFLGFFIQSTSTMPPVELDIGNQEKWDRILSSRSSE